MLELLISGQRVDLLPGASITIDEESPVFDSSSIPGGFSFPFSLPVTPRNRRILDFPDRLEKSGPMSIEQPFHLFFAGQLQLSGTIIIMEAGSEYKANLMINSGDLAAKIKDKKLKDLNLGGLRTWEWKSEYKFPEDDFALGPVFNTEYYKDEPLNDIYKEHYAKINAYKDGAFYHPDANDDPWVITPFPFLSYIIRQVFDFAEICIIENAILNDTDFRDLILYTIRDIAMVLPTYEVVTISWTQKGKVPRSIITKVAVSSGKEVTTFDLSDSMPDVKISDFLIAIRTLLNLSVIVDGNTVRIIKRQELVQKASACDITNQAVGVPQILQAKTDGFKLEFTVDSNDALWGEDYFKAIEDFKEYRKEDLQSLSELEDLEPEQNEIRLIIDEDYFVRYVYFAYDPADEKKFRWQWVPWSMNHQNYISGNGTEVFPTGSAPMLNVESIHFAPGTNGGQKGPFVEQKGAISNDGTVPAFALRLMFYRGLLKDSLGADYPCVTNDNLDRDGDQLPGKKLSLYFEGEWGIYMQLYQQYLTWWMNRRMVRWTIKDPSRLSFGEKYAIDGKHYLLKKRTINFTMAGIEPGECEFYLV